MDNLYYQHLNILLAVIGLVILSLILIKYRYDKNKCNARKEAKLMRKLKKKNHLR